MPEGERSIVHFEAGRALVIFRAGLPGVGIEELLALLLEIALFENEMQAAQCLLAVILDEIGADRALPFVGREVLAFPAIVAKAMANEIRQYPELVAVARQFLARVGDQALALGQPTVVEQHRSNDGEFVRRCSGVHPDLFLEVESARPIFELIVILEIDLMEPLGVWSALVEFSEVRERGRRRPAIGAAGVIDEPVRDLRDCRTDVDVPNVEPRGPVLTQDLLDRGQPDQHEDKPSGQAHHWVHCGPRSICPPQRASATSMSETTGRLRRVDAERVEHIGLMEILRQGSAIDDGVGRAEQHRRAELMIPGTE
jgi:hypothetical protein